MNYNRRVLYLVLSFTLTLLVVSVVQYNYGFSWKALDDINLLSDITKDSTRKAAKKDTANAQAEEVVVVKKTGEDFSLYTHGNLLTNFDADTTHASIEALMQKLMALKKGTKKKIRIAYIGDSMLEGDLITQTFRKLMQQEFGGSGVGFVPINSAVSKFRQTIQHNYSKDWKENSFKESDEGMAHIYISGHTFYGDGSWVDIKDNTIKDSAAIIQKNLLCGKGGETMVTVNGGSKSIAAVNEVNNVELLNDGSHSVRLAITNASMPVYGISFESESGVFVDNFSFRGVSGVEFAKIDANFLKAIQAANNYDLVVLQYGANLMFRPNDKNYSWYYKIMDKSVKHLKEAFGTTPFLLVSTADRAFKYEGEYKTAVGIDSLIKVQATLANNNDCSFYNLYQSMGGYGTIVKWANAKPALANKDYVHPNFKGAEVIGENIFTAFMNDYKKYITSYKK